MSNSRLENIQEMLKSEPEDSFLNYALALEYAKAGDIKKAISLIEQLHARDENYLGAYYQLGQFYEQNEQRDSAVTAYKKGIAIAELKKDRKSISELNEALMMLED